MITKGFTTPHLKRQASELLAAASGDLDRIPVEFQEIAAELKAETAAAVQRLEDVKQGHRDCEVTAYRPGRSGRVRPVDYRFRLRFGTIRDLRVTVRHSNARRAVGASEEHRPAARRTSSSSTTSGADPGYEPPARACKACGTPFRGSRTRKYCDTARCKRKRARDRQHRKRYGDLESQDDFRGALIAGMAGRRAFAKPGEHHALSYLWLHGLLHGDDPGEREAIRLVRHGDSTLTGLEVTK